MRSVGCLAVLAASKRSSSSSPSVGLLRCTRWRYARIAGGITSSPHAQRRWPTNLRAHRCWARKRRQKGAQGEGRAAAIHDREARSLMGESPEGEFHPAAAVRCGKITVYTLPHVCHLVVMDRADIVEDQTGSNARWQRIETTLATHHRGPALPRRRRSRRMPGALGVRGFYRRSLRWCWPSWSRPLPLS